MMTLSRPMMTNGSGSHGHKSVKKDKKKKDVKSPPRKPKDSKPK